MIVMGTTGSRPKTIVPAAVRVIVSSPPIDRTVVTAPGGGAGTIDCRIAIAATAVAVHSVTASAPHFVLPRQKSAATSSGASDE
jgi:hypothetical protein